MAALSLANVNTFVMHNKPKSISNQCYAIKTNKTGVCHPELVEGLMRRIEKVEVNQE